MGDLKQTRFLDDEEIAAFAGDLDKNRDGYIHYSEVEHRLDLVHAEIAPHPQPHHLHHDCKDDEARHRFLRGMMGSDQQRISRGEFAARGRSSWSACVCYRLAGRMANGCVFSMHST